MNDYFQRFADWLRRPYNAEMSVVGWFSFFGLLIVIVWLWGMILRKIEVG